MNDRSPEPPGGSRPSERASSPPGRSALDAPVLPAGTTLIHIGPQKTGSTALQTSLDLARDRLREHGVHYPGPGPRPARAAAAGLGFPLPAGAPPARAEEWDDLLRQLEEARGLRICLSHEAFGRATDEQIDRVVTELGGERPHVVAVARRLDTYLPSQWQQRVKANQELTYERWLHTVLDEPRPDDPVWLNVWVPHDTVSLLRRWSARVGRENLTLIVADPDDRTYLFACFERLLGLPDGSLPTDVDRVNRSMSYQEVELLRQVNRIFRRNEWPADDYFRLVHRGLIKHILASPGSPRDTPIPDLPRWAAERAVELSDRRIEGLRELGIRVVGDLEWLRCEVPDDVSDQLAAPPEDVPVETAVRALEAVMKGARKARRRDLRSHRREMERLEAQASRAPGGPLHRLMAPVHRRFGRS